MNKNLLATAAISMALAVGTVQTAHATPYGFASTTFNDFLITLTNATPNGGTVTVTTSQNYPGSASAGSCTSDSCAGGTALLSYAAGNPLASSVNAPNAFSSMATTNSTYTATTPGGVGAISNPSPILESALKSLIGAQASASVGNANVFSGSGDGSVGAVENGGRAGGGPLNATSSQAETVFTIAAGAGSPKAEFSFNAQVFVEAQTTVVGETASASTSNVINEFLCSTPSCSSTSKIGTFNPSDLNLTVNAGTIIQDNMDGSQTAFIPVDAVFNLTPGDTYQFNLSSQLTETTSSLAPVPEPTSLALLGTALALAGAMRRRRKV